MEIEKICKNCVRYVRIYIKKSAFYRPNGGYCTFRKGKIIVPVEKGCEKWKRREEDREEQARSVKKVLSDIADSLSQIAQILQDEK